MKIDQDDDLEPEAAEAGAALGLEVLALVLDGRLVDHGPGWYREAGAGNAARRSGGPRLS